MLAFAITAPLGSVTIPRSDDAAWPRATGAPAKQATRAITQKRTQRAIFTPRPPYSVGQRMSQKVKGSRGPTGSQLPHQQELGRSAGTSTHTPDYSSAQARKSSEIPLRASSAIQRPNGVA